jgi:hypothetical protein
VLACFSASSAQLAGEEDGPTEVVECLDEAPAVVTDEVSVRVLAREEAFELKEKVVELGGGCVDGV